MLGRLLTVPLLICGLLLIALPSFVLGREFSIVWEMMGGTDEGEGEGGVVDGGIEAEAEGEVQHAPVGRPRQGSRTGKTVDDVRLLLSCLLFEP